METRTTRGRPFQLAMVASLAAQLAAGVGSRVVGAEPPPLDDVAFGKQVLGQNWSWPRRETYWFRSQGSQLIDYSWFLHLEQAQSADLFRSDAHMTALGYITAPASGRNPDGLPIGFAKDPTTGNLGLTCAACHTGQIDYTTGGATVSLVVDGAPALANFGLFLNEVVDALNATIAQGPKFDRFASAVLAGDDSAHARQKLRDQLAHEAARLAARRNASRPPVSPMALYPGYGRLDAFGQVYNQVSGLDLAVPDNVVAPNGPASYPALWGAPWANVVQWNGSGKNRLAAGPLVIGPLLRNVVEVVGVFGELDFRFSPLGYDSKIDLRGLGELEGALCTLHAPRWPAWLFGALDRRLVTRGREIYHARGCDHCHALVADEQPFDTPLYGPEKLGTDPTQADNASFRSADTAWLAGKPKDFFNLADPFGKTAYDYEVLQNAVIGVVLHRPGDAVLAIQAGACRGITQPQPKDVESFIKREVERWQQQGGEVMPHKYRARPLNGIWATAPYLHNGSVPNLWELLKPEGQRQAVFRVGNREYDTIRVGFVSTDGPNTTEVDTAVPGVGSANTGHPFTRGLSEADRWALLEYLKSL